MTALLDTYPTRSASAPGRARPRTAAPAATPDEIRRRELAAFLRSRRERIAPERHGLVAGGRRRTPGLRREELAQLAGVGVTWYTWLEQGRDIHVSDQVLEAIARTLLLDRQERSHLFTLAGSSVATIASECQAVPASVHAVLRQLSPFPAAVVNGRYDLLAYNDAYQGLNGDLDALDLEQRNTMWLAFTSPVFRTQLVDYEESVGRIVAQFRAAMADHVAEPAWKCFVKRLQAASPEFAELWGRHDVAAPETVVKRFLHPELGLLRLTHTSLWLAPRQGVRVISYTAADDDAATVLPRLPEVTRHPLYDEA
ncbi:MAG TPA: helix-turn-helix transcriptional regulator [Motilibacteraceae bacterium]|nr:helix-turn-helix transcriptional regulator [Motilibacteraceae bacterium]